MSDYSVLSNSSEIRAKSRRILDGNWGQAVLVVLVFGLISGISGSFGALLSNDEGIFSAPGFAALSSLLSFAITIYTVLVINVLTFGYTVTFLKLNREGKVIFENLFLGFKDYGRVVGVMFLKNLFIFLWTLLFIIPGIVKTYAYSMTEFIIADNPQMDALSAITKSKEMMRGSKGKLFILDLSLIGWWFLSLFTCGIGYLWLMSYYLTNRAVFYQELSGDKGFDEPILGEPDDLTIEAAQKEIERINREQSDFS